jgi:transcriptional regulator GlxA family with amidase domain
MIAELLREFPTFTAWPQQPLSPIAQRALEWMKEHCERPVSVTDCAAAIPVNAAYLSRVLQKETGIPPVLHLQQMRIAHAKVLLQESRCTVEEVAHRSGFKTTEHFHRVFKKCTNLSPASFRRSTQKT